MHIRRAIESDIAKMVAISEVARGEYESYSPMLWRKAEHSAARQELHFQRLLTRADTIAFVAVDANMLAGFAVSAIADAPPVYNPGGPVCVIDDFAVANPSDWSSVGAALLNALEREAKSRGAVLTVIVCAQRDQAKRRLLQKAGTTVASEWHVKPL